LAVQLDVRSADDIEAVVKRVAQRYGRIDVLVYNSGAIWWSSVAQTPMKRFQLMQRVNIEGLYGMVQAVLPHLYRNGDGKKGAGRIVVVSPPVYSRFFRGKTAYAMGKVGMSVLTMGLAMDFEREGRSDTMAISSIWPAAVSASIIPPRHTLHRKCFNTG
jgi:NAD(P)-dependent dehydrogenase (short-subunit alcohol dehydrogenase family)